MIRKKTFHLTLKTIYCFLGGNVIAEEGLKGYIFVP